MTLAFLALLGAPYIYIHEISSLRVNLKTKVNIPDLTSSLLAFPVGVGVRTSLLVKLAVVVFFNFVAVAVLFVLVIAVVCDVAVFDIVTLGLCVTSNLNKPLT